LIIGLEIADPLVLITGFLLLDGSGIVLLWKCVSLSLEAFPSFAWPGKFGQHGWIEEVGGVDRALRRLIRWRVVAQRPRGKNVDGARRLGYSLDGIQVKQVCGIEK